MQPLKFQMLTSCHPLSNAMDSGAADNEMRFDPLIVVPTVHRMGPVDAIANIA